MKCASLGEYHDVYLATDVLLLFSVFKAFREVFDEMYGLDCACYFTAITSRVMHSLKSALQTSSYLTNIYTSVF